MYRCKCTANRPLITTWAVLPREDVLSCTDFMAYVMVSLNDQIRIPYILTYYIVRGVDIPTSPDFCVAIIWLWMEIQQMPSRETEWVGRLMMAKSTIKFPIFIVYYQTSRIAFYFKMKLKSKGFARVKHFRAKSSNFKSYQLWINLPHLFDLRVIEKFVMLHLFKYSYRCNENTKKWGMRLCLCFVETYIWVM